MITGELLTNTEVSITGDNMPPRTLLSLLSKGKYETSEDLPTMPDMAHSYIDNIIESYEESKQYEPEVKGTGLGMLEYATGPVGSLISPGSKAMKNILKLLERSNVNQKLVANLNKELIKKYKMHSVSKPPLQLPVKTPMEKMINRTLYSAMSQYNKYGTSMPGTESMLMRLFKPIKKQVGGYIAEPDVTRVNIEDDYSLYQPVNEQYGTPGVRHRNKTFFPLHAPSYQMIMERLLKDKLAPMIVGEALGYNKASNKKREKREGSRVINNLLNKLSIGDAPGGLVPYKTMRSQPWKSFGERGELFGELRDAKDATTAPDTAFFYNPYHKNVRQLQISYGAPHEAFHANPELQQRLWDREEFSTHQEAFHQLIDNLRKNIDAEELDSLQRLFLKGEELSNLPPILRNRKPK